MKPILSSLRQNAEIAFQKTQTQHLARSRLADELGDEQRLRLEKNLRLKAARLSQQPIATQF